MSLKDVCLCYITRAENCLMPLTWMGHGPLSISEMWSSVLLWCWSTKYACACVACTDLSPRAFTCAHAFVFIVCLSPLWRVRTSSTHIHTLIPILRARSSCVRVHVEFFVYNNIPGNHKAVGLINTEYILEICILNEILRCFVSSSRSTIPWKIPSWYFWKTGGIAYTFLFIKNKSQSYVQCAELFVTGC